MVSVVSKTMAREKEWSREKETLELGRKEMEVVYYGRNDNHPPVSPLANAPSPPPGPGSEVAELVPPGECWVVSPR